MCVVFRTLSCAAQSGLRREGEKIFNYHSHRDIPSIKGTSGLSPYLAAGVISPRYVLRSLINAYPDILLASDSEEFSWLNELIWREFYRNLMFHEQRLCKHQCFKESYQSTYWHFDKALFDRKLETCGPSSCAPFCQNSLNCHMGQTICFWISFSVSTFFTASQFGSAPPGLSRR